MQKLLRFPQVIEKTGLARATINRNEKAGRFPRRMYVTPNVCAWWDHEIDEHCEANRVVRSVSP